MTRGYRPRVYDSYISSRPESIAPSTLDGLSPRAPYLRRLVRKHFPENKGASILDIGCGHGALIHFAREAGYRNVQGVDGSPEQVEAAQRLGIEGVEQGDLKEVLEAWPDAALDVVVAFDVIEHFTRDELLTLVDQTRRVLKPGGRWIIHVPNGESPFGGRMRYGDLTRELAFTRISLSQLLLASGFREVHCFEDSPVVHGAKSAVRWILWKGIRGMLRLYIATETGNASREHIFSQNMLAVATK